MNSLGAEIVRWFGLTLVAPRQACSEYQRHMMTPSTGFVVVVGGVLLVAGVRLLRFKGGQRMMDCFVLG